MEKVFISSSPEETERIARDIAQHAAPGDFFALTGELGAGKTVFARGFVLSLIPDANVSSPTYAIMNVYRGQNVTVNHFDTYRITSEDDLESTGFYEATESGITLCEWPEKIPYALPEAFWEVRIDKRGEQERVITLSRIEK